MVALFKKDLITLLRATNYEQAILQINSTFYFHFKLIIFIQPIFSENCACRMLEYLKLFIELFNK
jgi:hypothetical protein